jgi:methylenetetrahydrofolate dehydrogenase (NADP+)/methenyltetrahydrofolate cyclohydrolase
MATWSSKLARLKGTRNGLAQVIDGKAVAAEERNICRRRVEALKRDYGISPGLAVVMVGDNPASTVYVRNKMRACDDVGIKSQRFLLTRDAAEDELIGLIQRLAEDRAVHGILVQLPLPKGYNLERVLSTIPVEKDVDGFHLYNVGGLVVGGTVFPPCTPYGVMRLLDHEEITVEGKNAVVVGASNIVGKPMALMLLQREATVCVCHAKTRDLAQFTSLADILVVAAGRPNLITGAMVKKGAVVIDVGINRLPDGQLVGDCDFESVSRKAAFITPVPGGVGQMTVTMLLVNTINSAELAVTGGQ